MKGAVYLPLALLFANMSALAISLAIPLLIPANQYSIFALCWSIGQLVASIAFEWMRFGVLRYAVGQDQALATRRSANLWQGYFLTAASLLAIAVISGLWLLVLPFAGFIAAVAFYAACQGAFEGRQALARAHADNGYYSLSWVLRTFISLILSAAAAWFTGSGAASLVGLALSYPITLLLMNRSLRVHLPPRSVDVEQMAFLAKHGFFAALATILSMLLASVLRGISVSMLGLEQAGGLLLAIDLSQKAISVVGLALNVVMMQRSIQTAEFGSEADIKHQTDRHIGLTAALIIPASLGFFLVQDSFVDIFVQQEYRESYWAAIGWACIAGGILSFRQFAVDSLFVALGKTTGAIWGPVITIALSALAIWALGFVDARTPSGIAIAFVISISIGALASFAALGRVRKINWPIGDILKIAAASSVMVVAYFLLPPSNPIVSLLITLTICGGAYCITALALDVAGLRNAVSLLFERMSHRTKYQP
jgi:O-antigen/teichoic acid export membrane protein